MNSFRTSFAATLFLVFGFSFVTSATVLAQNLPLEGVYNGEIAVANGAPVKMSLQLRYSNTEVPSDPGDVVPTKKQMVGTFTIEDEAGPYNMSYVNYNLVKGYFDLYYVRPAANGGTTGGTSTSAPSVFSLHFSAKYAKETISGDLDSGRRGYLGKFSLKRVSTAKVLATHPHLGIGIWRGQWAYKNVEPDAIKLYLSASAGATVNPTEYELENTPARVASITFSGGITVIPFPVIYFDYFTHSIQMLYTNVTNGASLTVNGVVDDASIVGTAVAPFNARVAKFNVTRIAE